MQSILFAPTPPTPNGPLHLGHASGPYLTSDFLRRCAERNGARCATVCGSDVFESYVLLAARMEGCSPEEICTRYSQEIKGDLAKLDIKLDRYLLPLNGEDRDRLVEANHRVYRGFHDAGVLTRLVERLPFSRTHQMFALGCWLYGECPRCGAPAGCFACENCYSQYRPEELKNPACRLEDPDLEWRDVTTLALQLPGFDWLKSAIEGGRIPERYSEVVRNSIGSNGMRVRLSIPGYWGIHLLPEAELPGQIYFSSTALLAYALVVGEIASSLLGRVGNVFDPDSAVTTVRLLGCDGAVHHLAGSFGGAQLLDFAKPFDYMVINSFYLHCGQKFSTSRRHAVWVRQAIAELGIPSDVIRWYVARTSPMHGRTNFDPDDFALSVNRVLRQQVSTKMKETVACMGDHEACSIGNVRRDMLEEALTRQDTALGLQDPDPRKAATEIEEWCSTGIRPGDRSDAYWWLKGLSLIAYPIMPRLGQTLWFSLGHVGQPSRQLMYTVPRRGEFGECPAFSALTPDQVRRMRPATGEP